MSEINSFSMYSDSTSSVDSERNESMGGNRWGNQQGNQQEQMNRKGIKKNSRFLK